uniref:Uncharacterized protein TCIL3000_10_13570 n=1 Tax=Trypanosoma congolense (strain IL3000) TaxID=1068625 RepID=G0UYV5_TRYCI|nr:unnamed protein product [Trypanosoma congolense IL3000]
MRRPSYPQRKRKGEPQFERRCLYCQQQGCPGVARCKNSLNSQQISKREIRVLVYPGQEQQDEWIRRAEEALNENLRAQSLVSQRREKLLQSRRRASASIDGGKRPFVEISGSPAVHISNNDGNAPGQQAENGETLDAPQQQLTAATTQSALPYPAAHLQSSTLTPRIKVLEGLIKELVVQNTTQATAISELKTWITQSTLPTSHHEMMVNGVIDRPQLMATYGVGAASSINEFSRSTLSSIPYGGKKELMGAKEVEPHTQPAYGVSPSTKCESLAQETSCSFNASGTVCDAGKGVAPTTVGDASRYNIVPSATSTADEVQQLQKQLLSAELKISAWETWYMQREQCSLPAQQPESNPLTAGASPPLDKHAALPATDYQSSRQQQQRQHQAFLLAVPVAGDTGRFVRYHGMPNNAAASNAYKIDDTYGLLARQSVARANLMAALDMARRTAA